MQKYSFMVKDEDLDKLLENLPLFIKEHVNNHPDKEKIVEIIKGATIMANIKL